VHDLPAVLLQLPFTVIQRADVSRLQPARNAMEVEGVVADSPCGVTLLTCGRHLVSLAIDAEIHDVVPADGAVVHDDIPSPESDSVPLLHFEARLPSLAARLAFVGGRVNINVHISHDVCLLRRF